VFARERERGARCNKITDHERREKVVGRRVWRQREMRRETGADEKRTRCESMDGSAFFTFSVV
jgi:hypothetical protein